MDDVRTPVPPPSLYEADEYAWYFQQIAALREGRLSELDRENLAEFLEDVSKRETREIESRFTVLVQHILKCVHQPDRLSRSWVLTIMHQREELRTIFGYSATLARAAPDLLQRVYPRAIRAAEIETGLPRGTIGIPEDWSVDDVLSYEPPPLPGDFP